jgi:hypothetical protein
MYIRVFYDSGRNEKFATLPLSWHGSMRLDSLLSKLYILYRLYEMKGRERNVGTYG